MMIGRNIRAVRKRRGLTLDELSALCGVSRDDLGLYERGQMTPRPGTVKKIADALDVPMETVSQGMGWTAQERAEPWEDPDSGALRDGVLEAVRESCGEELALEEGEVRELMEAVKASIPALAERMKDTRPQAEIDRELLAQLSADPESEADLSERRQLTDWQWEQIAPLLPPERAGRGRAFKSNRLMLEGILYRMRSGQPWSRLPERYGRYKCVSDRLRLWQSTGVWERVLEKMAEIGALDGAGER